MKNSHVDTLINAKLKTVSELIQAGVSTRVYYISISGFDTHINQPGQQERLLRSPRREYRVGSHWFCCRQ